MSAPAPSAHPTTRDRLIAAAFRVVAREGLEAASVKAIAAEAGLAAGLLHYHFPTKDALLEAALRAGLEAYVAAGRERRAATPAAGQLAALFTEASSALESDADVFRVRLAFAVRALSDPALAQALAEMNAVAAEETALTLAAARGAIAPTAAERDLARVLKAAFDGLILACLTDPAFPIDAARDLLLAATTARLASLAEASTPS